MTSSGLNKYHLVEEAKSSGLLAMAEIPTPAGRHDVLTGIYDTDHKLNISVVFTSIESTLAALKEAGRLADNLNASIILPAPQIVPYPSPLADPPVLMDFNEKPFTVIAGQKSGGHQDAGFAFAGTAIRRCSRCFRPNRSSSSAGTSSAAGSR